MSFAYMTSMLVKSLRRETYDEKKNVVSIDQFKILHKYDKKEYPPVKILAPSEDHWEPGSEDYDLPSW